MNRVICIGLDVLVEYPSKNIRNQAKMKYINEMLSGFMYSKGSNSFCISLVNQLTDYVKNQANDSSLIDVSSYKLFSATIPILKSLKDKGFYIVVTSDSSNSIKCKTIISKLGLDNYIDKLIPYETIQVKKNTENYVLQLIKSLNQAENSEFWIVASRVDKEIISAFKSGIKHIWINLSLENIVLYI